MQYSHLSEDQQKQIIEDRLLQFEAEHFNHELNKLNLASLPDSEDKDAQLKTAESAQKTIEGAIEVHRAQLEKLSSKDKE